MFIVPDCHGSISLSGALFIDLTLNNAPSPSGNAEALRLTHAVEQITRRREALQRRPMDIPPAIDPLPLPTNRNGSSSSFGSLTGRGGALRISDTILRTPIDNTLSGINRLGVPPTKDECLARQTELWCDPQGPWDVTPGVARWCLLNCRSDNCDNTRCACECIDETLFRIRYEQISLRAP